MDVIKRISTVFLIIVCCAAASGRAEVVFSVADKSQSGRIAAGEMLVEIKRGVVDLGEEKGIVALDKARINSDSMEALNKKYGLVSIERLFSGIRKDEQSDIYVFRFPADVNMRDIVSSYEKDGDVFYAEPNYVVRPLKEDKPKE